MLIDLSPTATLLRWLSWSIGCPLHLCFAELGVRISRPRCSRLLFCVSLSWEFGSPDRVSLYVYACPLLDLSLSFFCVFCLALSVPSHVYVFIVICFVLCYAE